MNFTRELTKSELDAAWVRNTITKCIVTEPKVAQEKKLNVYRQLSTDTIHLLVEHELKVETNKEPIDGIYHIITWESLKNIGEK